MIKTLPLNRLIPLMAIYCLVTIIGMYHHELWLDDVQHWLVARDSKSFAELLRTESADDHVPLWTFCLFIVTHFISDNTIALQTLHLLVINTAVFIFLRYAAFDLVAKTLILFGYYFIFEYSILCRNYALGITFLFIACALLSKPERNLIKIGVLLIPMCCTHEFFAFAACSIFLYLVYYNYEDKKLNKRFFAFTLLFLIGFAIPVWHVLHMPSDTVDFQLIKPSWLTVHNVSFAIHGIDKGFIPIPPLHDPNFWNRHLFEAWSSFIKVPISLFFLIYPILVLKNSRKALIYYISASFLLLLFLTVSQMSASRHYGMFFIFFITAIWLSEYDGANVLSVNNRQQKTALKAITTCMFYLILLIQVFAGLFIYEQDYNRPFSQGKNTVQFIRGQHLDNLPVVIDVYNAGAVLSAYFRHPIYYLDNDAMGSYFADNRLLSSIKQKSLTQEINESKYLPSIKEFIFISNRANTDSAIVNTTGYSFSKLNCFSGAIIPVENYCIYRVVKVAP